VPTVYWIFHIQQRINSEGLARFHKRGRSAATLALLLLDKVSLLCDTKGRLFLLCQVAVHSNLQVMFTIQRPSSNHDWSRPSAPYCSHGYFLKCKNCTPSNISTTYFHKHLQSNKQIWFWICVLMIMTSESVPPKKSRIIKRTKNWNSNHIWSNNYIYIYCDVHAVGLTLLGNVHAVGLRVDVSWWWLDNQQCQKQCLLYSPPKGYISRTMRRSSQFKES
jgi:hypothetical protein